MRDVVIVDSVRTGLTKAFRGSFNLTRSDDLLAHCIDSLLDRNPQLGPDEVEDVYVGAASHAGERTVTSLVWRSCCQNCLSQQLASPSTASALQVYSLLRWQQTKLLADKPKWPLPVV